MVVTFCLDISVRHQEHGENDRDDIPTGEDESKAAHYKFNQEWSDLWKC